MEFQKKIFFEQGGVRSRKALILEGALIYFDHPSGGAYFGGGAYFRGFTVYRKAVD
jgi:hypothetical protein